MFQWMFFKSVKEINRLLKEINRLLSKGMSKYLLRIYCWEKVMYWWVGASKREKSAFFVTFILS